MTFKQTFKYIHHLQDFADSYNKSKHSSIGMAPKEGSEENAAVVWNRLYWPTKTEKVKRLKFKYDIGDYVRLSYLRRAFQREYDHNWTGEVFKISRRYLRGGLPIYRVQDFKGNDLQGTFYQDELQKVVLEDDKLWKIDHVIKERKRGSRKEYLVRWLYWPKSFDSWVDELVDI